MCRVPIRCDTFCTCYSFLICRVKFMLLTLLFLSAFHYFGAVSCFSSFFLLFLISVSVKCGWGVADGGNC